MSAVVFRIAKLKSAAAINGAGKHNHRERETEVGESLTLNADPQRTPDNVVLKTPEGKSTYEAVMDVIGDQRVRSNAVLAIEAIISASPSYFRPDDPAAAGTYEQAALDRWREAVEPWIAERFPHAVSVVLHLDESTPHYHIIDVPLAENGKLSARSKFAGPRDLARWQTDAAKAVEHLGISRGRESSEAHHLQVKKFYGAVTKRGGWQEISAKAEHYDAAAKQASVALAMIERLTAENEISKSAADKLRALDPRDVLERMYGARVSQTESSTGRTMFKSRLQDGRQVVTTAQGAGYCWTQDGKTLKRSSIDLVMALDGCDYKAAVARLAHAFGDRAAAAEHVAAVADRAAVYVQEAKAQHPARSAAPSGSQYER